MATLFDELNSLGKASVSARSKDKRRSVPYNEFFGEMYLDPEEKEKRIEMANALDDVFLFMFAALALFADTGDITLPVIYEMAERRYKDAIEPFLTAKALESMAIDNIIANQVRVIADSTLKNINDPYYTSEDRAMFIAENQTNMVQNQVLEEEAEAQGKKYKIWVSMRDNHVREDHRDADGQRVRIGTPFVVGGELLMHPCDDSLGASGAQIVNCRCVVEYSDKESGALSGAWNDENDPYGIERERVATEQYEQIRNRKREFEISAVAKHSGMSVEDIDKVFAHIFEREHLFADGTVHRFDPDYYMYHSWQRLREGKNIQPHDIIMLKHELAEEKIMGSGLEINYQYAHNIAESEFSYSKALTEYLKEHDA